METFCLSRWVVLGVIRGSVLFASCSRQSFVTIAQSFFDRAHSTGAAIIPRAIVSAFGTVHQVFTCYVQVRFGACGVSLSFG